jgi:hypothetical protein
VWCTAGASCLDSDDQSMSPHADAVLLATVLCTLRSWFALLHVASACRCSQAVAAALLLLLRAAGSCPSCRPRLMAGSGLHWPAAAW